MPNKTIYVSDDDVAVLERAQQVSGGNLSGAVVEALRAYVRAADYRDAGYDEVVLRDGPDGVRRKRFFGRLLAEETAYDENTGNATKLTAYEGRTGKIVLSVHFVDWANYGVTHRQKTGHWLKDLTGIPSVRSLFSSELPDWGDYTVEIVDDIDDLRKLVPQRFFERAAAALAPDVEDLDV
ncbi:EXLDI protein [Gordonia sp. zg691]|uniref:EXLDI protein n=1 Tax=Gordonia jinghuaiqii TaxID=2758710 RepID=UPI0016625363|nr:EXLDI protein [Gordonia jinghuaiqii]MBD0863317.1 EXLDI protein [Gordonia jinghuaiqii]